MGNSGLGRGRGNPNVDAIQLWSGTPTDVDGYEMDKPLTYMIYGMRNGDPNVDRLMHVRDME